MKVVTPNEARGLFIAIKISRFATHNIIMGPPLEKAEAKLPQEHPVTNVSYKFT